MGQVGRTFIGEQISKVAGKVGAKEAGAKVASGVAEAARGLDRHSFPKAAAKAAPAADQGIFGQAIAWFKSFFPAKAAAKPAAALSKETLEGIGSQVRASQQADLLAGRVTPAQVEEMATKAMAMAKSDPAKGLRMMQAANDAAVRGGHY